VWWCVPIIQALCRLRQENHKFRPGQPELPKKKKRKKEKKKEGRERRAEEEGSR
jgi:hypothetical protein